MKDSKKLLKSIDKKGKNQKLSFKLEKRAAKSAKKAVKADSKANKHAEAVKNILN